MWARWTAALQQRRREGARGSGDEAATAAPSSSFKVHREFQWRRLQVDIPLSTALHAATLATAASYIPRQAYHSQALYRSLAAALHATTAAPRRVCVYPRSRSSPLPAANIRLTTTLLVLSPAHRTDAPLRPQCSQHPPFLAHFA